MVLFAVQAIGKMQKAVLCSRDHALIVLTFWTCQQSDLSAAQRNACEYYHRFAGRHGCV